MRHGQIATSFLIAYAVLAIGSSAKAVDDRMARTLMRVEPDTRLEQVCDIEAMLWVGRTTKLKPDRAKSDISAHPIHMGDTMKAPGAAFRSKGLWYALSFECTGTADHLGVLSFSFKVGKPIPKNLWADLGLWG
jgi:hypothetical protein